MKPSEYELADFVQDPSFRNWVHKTRKEDTLFWDIWLENHPEKAVLVEEAALLVRGVRFNKKTQPVEEIQEAWKNLRVRLQGERQARQKTGFGSFFKGYGGMAAGLLSLLGAGAVLWYLASSTGYHTYRTDFGETTTLVLPDSSIVTLNANTTLRYPKAWHTRPEREVWLEGEAFLSVTHTQTHQPFRVHIPQQVSVEVLGTEFNVSSRKSGNRVVLSSGTVRLNLPHEPDETDSEPTYVLMRPGEMLQFTDSPADYTIREVNPALYSCWKDKRFLFDDTPIREIAQMLEENFGYQVRISSQALANRKLTGEIETDDPDLLLRALSTSFDIRISKENNTVWLRDNG